MLIADKNTSIGFRIKCLQRLQIRDFRTIFRLGSFPVAPRQSQRLGVSSLYFKLNYHLAVICTDSLRSREPALWNSIFSSEFLYLCKGQFLYVLKAGLKTLLGLKTIFISTLIKPKSQVPSFATDLGIVIILTVRAVSANTFLPQNLTVDLVTGFTLKNISYTCY